MRSPHVVLPHIMTRRPFIGGNLKANGNPALCKKLAEAAKDAALSTEVVYFPPDLLNHHMKPYCATGTQNIDTHGLGAHTGNSVALEVAISEGLGYCIIGHSERRQGYETMEDLEIKVKRIQETDMIIVFCVGENEKERTEGKHFEVVKKHMSTLFQNVTDWSKVVVAYEPVWSINTGLTASPEQAEEMCGYIRQMIEEKVNSKVAAATRTIYGGSVNKSNAESLFSQNNIDGFLVGGASLKPDFVSIIEATQ